MNWTENEMEATEIEIALQSKKWYKDGEKGESKSSKILTTHTR